MKSPGPISAVNSCHLTPSHARLSLEHINYTLQIAMVMGVHLDISVEIHCSCPMLAGTGLREISCHRASHAGSLWRIAIEIRRRDDTDTFGPSVSLHAVDLRPCHRLPIRRMSFQRSSWQ